MDVTQRRYLEGFFHGLRARDAGAVLGGGGNNGQHAVATALPLPADPWRVLLACAAEDRPPRAGERAGLRALGVADLGSEGRDGCRLRFRAPGGRLRAWQLRELAAVSQDCAGGFLEFGACGGPELAVVGWREAAGALARLRGVGLAGGDEVLWCSPASGLDAGEVFDVMALAMTLDAGMTAGDGPRVRLDGGARGWSGSAAAAGGLELRAVVGGSPAGVVFRVTAGGTSLRVPAGGAAAAAWLLAGKFRENGGGWGGLDAGELREELGASSSDPAEGFARMDLGLSPGTTFAQKQPRVRALVAAGPGDGRWRSRGLLALAGLTEEIGAGEARLWPGGVLVPGVAEAGAETGLARLAGIVALVR